MFIKPVILCGGYGTRLWPESRKNLPKQFIKFFEEKSLLELTLDRLEKFDYLKKLIIVTSLNYQFIINDILKKRSFQASMLLEPESKNTTAAIYLAAKFSDEKDILLIMPSDHLINDHLLFKNKIVDILSKYYEENWVTFGIKPTHASDAFGYIKIDGDAKISEKNSNVIKFIEKPNLIEANNIYNKPNFFWNSGIFAGKSSMIIDSIKKHAPNIAYACDIAFNNSIYDPNTDSYKFVPKNFKQIPSESIDYAIMEKAKNVICAPVDFLWNDLGSWDSLAKLPNSKKSNNKIFEINSNNNFIRNNNKVIATIGINNTIIIDTKDATLIAKKDNSEKVKLIVNQLKKRNISEGLVHSFEIRPWGKFENLLDNKECKVKRIEIDPHKRISLQYHNYRSEHWLVVKGTAKVYLNGKMFTLKKGMSIDIPKKAHHYIENIFKSKLVIIETQIGEYFGEDDIIRLDDPYNR